MCSGFKCIAQHYFDLMTELFLKMSQVTLSLCYFWIIIIAAFYNHFERKINRQCLNNVLSGNEYGYYPIHYTIQLRLYSINTSL